MMRSPVATGGLIVATIVAGLWADRFVQPAGQLAATVGAWLALALVLRALPRAGRTSLLLCVVIAGAGECFLSLGWGLYSYRLGNMPLFVPPGHALLFALGQSLAPKMTTRLVWATPLIALPFVLGLAWIGSDTLGLPLFALFVGCLLVGKAKKLYATMFVLVLPMELYGTWLGNWTWVPRAPWLNLAMQNPPIAAGALYCVLDVLVTALTPYFWSSFGALGPLPAHPFRDRRSKALRFLRSSKERAVPVSAEQELSVTDAQPASSNGS